MFKNKILLITGGTGSFGKTVLDNFLSTEIKEIRIFSRDEKKQDEMRKLYNDKKLKFYIGDVRDYGSILNATRGVDYLFHAAALKQVPSCEFYPLEALKTNVQGTENVLEASITNKVRKIVCLSTDKAVYPINAMGISKAMMEKVLVAKSRQMSNKDTIITATRYGNVMASRGSVIPLFFRQIQAKKPITITNPDMTRFMMTLNDAVDLVMHTFKHGKNGDIFVQKSPSATLEILVRAICKITNTPNYPIEIIGTRHGEKLYESLCSSEEMLRATDQGKYFRIPSDNRDLNYTKYHEQGKKELSLIRDYNSHNATQLDLDGMIKLLNKLDFISNAKSDQIQVPDTI